MTIVQHYEPRNRVGLTSLWNGSNNLKRKKLSIQYLNWSGQTKKLDRQVWQKLQSQEKLYKLPQLWKALCDKKKFLHIAATRNLKRALSIQYLYSSGQTKKIGTQVCEKKLKAKQIPHKLPQL